MAPARRRAPSATPSHPSNEGSQRLPYDMQSSRRNALSRQRPPSSPSCLLSTSTSRSKARDAPSRPPTTASGPYQNQARRSHTPAGQSNSQDGTSLQTGSENNSNLDAAQHDITMAIELKTDGSLGCAYYSYEEHGLYLLEDAPMADIDFVERLLVHAQPTTVLLPMRSPETMLQYMDRVSDEGGAGLSFSSRHLGSAEFSHAGALERILELEVGTHRASRVMFSSDLDDTTQEKECSHVRLARLGSTINTDCHLSIGCCGAVLGDVRRRHEALMLSQSLGVSSIQMFTLANYMFINVDTLASLQILRSELHPNSQVWGSEGSAHGAKESLSVYGLFHHLACTPQGKSKLRQIFLRPTTDIDIIKQRQRAISILAHPENGDALACLGRSLRKVQNIRRTLDLLQKGIEAGPGTGSGRGSSDRGTWATLQRFSAHSIRIREILARVAVNETTDLVEKVLSNIRLDGVNAVGELISQTVDFNQSEARSRAAVAYGVDRELDEHKRAYDGMESLLTKVASELSLELPEWARRYIQSCVFFPQLGFLTVVELDSATGRGNYDGEGLQDDAWEKMFTAEDSVYYKTRRMRELDSHFGDLYCCIVDMEIEILHRLAGTVLQYRDELILASDACGDLDALVALATGAQKYAWAAPVVTAAANVIRIKDGRHPLQELVVPQYMPNDCHLSGGAGDGEGPRPDGLTSPGPEDDEYPGVLILTGPNHSGKSVYLKQVALIVYLAHIGSFVPAESATIGITDKILTRISTRESVCRNESAFSIDLRQIGFSLRSATRRSLILVDEFGKGTKADDGAGLMAALIDHFLGQGSNAPRFLAATHFHELFEGGYLDRHGHTKYALSHMDVRMDPEASPFEDQVLYLYKLKPDKSTSSFGSWCAAMNGVDGAVVQRADAISLLLARNEDLRSVYAKLTEDEQQDLENAERTARRFLSLDLGEARRNTRGQTISAEQTLRRVLWD